MFRIDEIARFFRIPPHMIGDLEPALIPESFHTDILKEELDDNGVPIDFS